MLNPNRLRNTLTLRLTHLARTLVYLSALVGLLVIIDRLDEITYLDSLVPYKQYHALADVAILGWLTISSGNQWVHELDERNFSPDAAAPVRIMFRIVGGGVLVSVSVGLLTSSSASALTIGSFTGLVAGYAMQTVLGNVVAGFFMALLRPIRVGENVAIAGNSGRVIDITLMHVVLETEDREIMVPSSNVTSKILVRHKEPED